MANLRFQLSYTNVQLTLTLPHNHLISSRQLTTFAVNKPSEIFFFLIAIAIKSVTAWGTKSEQVLAHHLWLNLST